MKTESGTFLVTGFGGSIGSALMRRMTGASTASSALTASPYTVARLHARAC